VLSEELLDRARAAGRPEVAAQAHHWRIFNLLQAGAVHAARREFASLAGLARELHQPLYRHFVAAWRGQGAEMAGRFEEAERLAGAALQEGRNGQVRDADAVFAGQLYAIRRDQGRLPEMRRTIQQLSERYPTILLWRILLMDVFLEAEDFPRARATFEVLAADGFSSVPRDLYRLTSLSLLGEAAARMEEREHAATLYALLEPHAGRFIQTGLMFSSGSVERVLGLLAAATARPTLAHAHFERALDRDAALGAPALVARTRRDYARVLGTSMHSPSASSQVSTRARGARSATLVASPPPAATSEPTG
jgi:hypothetical protein